MSAFRRWYPALGLALLAGCTAADSATLLAPAEEAPALARASDPQNGRWVHRAPHAPPFKNEVVRLAARVGEPGEATLTFADGSPFARLRLAPESLRGATVNGTPVAEGHDLVISLRRVDASRYLVELQPAGLLFNPAAPAELVFFYENSVVSAAEPISVWKQDRRGDAWQLTEHEDDRSRRQMRARVKDFTVYAMGYGRSARVE